MKKILILANLFHASPRIPAFAKYLAEFGWEPTILTVPITKDPRINLLFPSAFREKVRIIEVPYQGDIFWFWRKLLIALGLKEERSILDQMKSKVGVTSKKSFIDYIFKFYQTLFAYPDEEKNWEKPLFKAAGEVLTSEKFDAILSSSSPVITHIVAQKLKRKYYLPWLADFRDLWTQNNAYPYYSWRKMIEEKLEVKTLTDSDALITVSEPLVRKLEQLHEGKEVYNIMNSFDPEKVNNPAAILTPELTITYTGQLFIGSRDPEKLLIALKELIEENKVKEKDLKVRFYGPENTWLENKIQEIGLSRIVKQYGKTSREDAFKKQRESQILLLLNWKGDKSEGVYTGKLFEYLVAKRPILATEGGEKGNVIKELLERTGAGVSGNDVKTIKELILNLYSEYKQEGQVKYRGNWVEISKYNHRETTKQFAEILNNYSGEKLRSKGRKVLIISNLFYSSPRIPALAKHLSEFGWASTILTVSIKEDPRHLLAFPPHFLEKVRIVETFYQGDIFQFWRKIAQKIGFKINKSILTQTKEKVGVHSPKSFIDYIFKIYQAIFAYPDEEKNWIRPAFEKVRELLEREKFDAIISSSSPVTAHIIASELKKKYRLFWIADFRDLWTQNHDYRYPWWRKIFERQLELKTLSSADVLVTVSQPLADQLKEFHQKEMTFKITNGFYPEELSSPPFSLRKKFTITYSGTLYAGKQDPKELFLATRELISEKVIDPEDVEIRFYSGSIPWLEKEIENYRIESLVKIYEKISRDEIIKKEGESQILLLIYWGDRKEKGWQSLKIFGYLAAKRPILVMGGSGEDVVEEMIRETKSGFYCKSFQDIKNFLKKSYLEYKEKGAVSYQGDLNEVKKHSYKEKAKEFAQILDNHLLKSI